MRDAILNALGAVELTHFGHAYDMLAPPPKEGGKPDPKEREKWFDRYEKIAVDPEYRHFFDLWRRSFPTTATLTEITAKTRILIGHGNPSGSEVGLTVHRTWGVPVLPGSALKGLLAHYIDVVYGGDGEEREPWRGPTWDGRIVAQKAGWAFTTIFGTPAEQGQPESARGGGVVFHDALYVPGPAGIPDKPFARDVLTVHQSEYYRNNGTKWPTDWDSPIPVGFFTVRPGAKFLLALTGPQNLVDRAQDQLLKALADWGIGGKTSAGYGRLSP